MPRDQRRDFLKDQLTKVFRGYFVNVFVIAAEDSTSHYFSDDGKGWAFFDNIYGDPVVIFLN